MKAKVTIFFMIKQAERHRGTEIKFNEVKEHSRNHLFCASLLLTFKIFFVTIVKCSLCKINDRRDENPLSQWTENVNGSGEEEN
jgi:hypothetical protein